jgi:glycerol-3-phosphate dehydrogenase
MQRDLPAMSATRFDVLVIGGGIVGATVAWDAVLRGLRVGLIEKGDFGQGTSSATSKLIHGGLRYLKQMELGLVRESLRERRILSTITPHLVSPLPFLIPAYGWGERLSFSAAARLYNTLSYDRNRVPYADQEMPGARILNREDTLERAPDVASDDLAGSMLYYDAQLYDPARHLLEFIHSAARHGTQVANYAEAIDFAVDDGTLREVVIRDHLTDQAHSLTGRIVVNATGPWANALLNRVRADTSTLIRRSKGIHILTRPLTSLDHALVLPTPDERHLFVLPWRDHALIGTTDVPFEGDPDEVAVTEADLRAFLDTINATLPFAQLTRDDVLHFYAGLRPLAGTGADEASTYRASRKHAIVHHAGDGIRNLYTAIGGKYTTARHLAEQLVDQIFETLERPSVPCTTDVVPTAGGDTGPFDSFLRWVRQHFSALPDAVADHLARSYGTRITEVMATAQRGPVLMQRPNDRTPDIMAQVDYAVEHEMAQTLDDVLLRRTGMGTLGAPSLDTMEAVAQRMASRLNWSSQRFDDEVETMRERYWPASSPASTTT